MRRSFATVVIAAALWSIAPAASMAMEPPSNAIEVFATPQTAPTTPFAHADGTTKTLADWRGKVIVLNFWATWCAPCIRELPSFDSLAAKLPSNQFAVLILSTDRGGAGKAPGFLKKLGIKNLAPYVDDKSKLARSLGLRGLPTTFILDADGQIRAKLAGPAEWDEPEFVAWIKSFANE